MTTDRRTLTLYNTQQGFAEMSALWLWCKAMLMAGHRLHVAVKPASRSLEQNAKFHAICDDLERARIEWAGKPRSAAEWKVLLVSGHAMATKQRAEIVHGLEGEWINIQESTARMGSTLASSLIEYSLAFAASMGVVCQDLSEPA